MLGEGARLESFELPSIIFVAAGRFGAYLPHALFTPMLLRARLAGLRDYGGLVSEYARGFHARWIRGSDRMDCSGHIQALADLGTSYREQVEALRLSLFSRADRMLLLGATLAPAVPLLLLHGSAHDAVLRIAKLLIG